ncbi:MAG: sugar phosphate nucleotidyltransferase [Bacteroidetes bacterium]|jgi:mannose-1-phosphate guanylyltransferase/phosphomannomutase|nr:sugar phosphate nucleotidyltransferase [Bacteroidota bacterium]
MKAVIMAGGFGTRLRPLTCNIPKPMVPMANRPMMEHIVALLKRHGITNIVSTLFYQPDVIAGHFGDGHAHGVKMQYRRADADYGTAGSVRNAKDFLDERFIIISGDVLTDFDLSAAVAYHEQKKAKATILLTHVPDPLQFGVVITRDDGKITRFLEKPAWGEVFSDTINTGIYILEPDVMNLVPEKEEFDFSKNLWPILLERDMGLYGCVAEGYWRDVGNLNEYQEANLDVIRGRVKLPLEGRRVGDSYVGDQSLVETDIANLSGMNIIGRNTRIHANARIANSVIGDDCEVLSGAVIQNSVIWSGTQIGAKAELASDVVGFKTIIGDEVTVLENVFVGDQCVIGRRSKLLSNIKLWPEKAVEEGSTVTRSLVWEERWLRDLFTYSRVTGLSNIEMNPEFGAKLGAAFGALVGLGATVVTSRDSDNVSRMINRALMTGLMSSGVHVTDLRAASIPVVRHELMSGKERGGIHVRKSPFDRNFTDIIFFDAGGKDLPTSKIKSVERLFFGEDFPRASYDKVGTIHFPERATEAYIERFLAAVNTSVIRNSGLKLVIDYSHGIASTVFPNILGDMNVQVVALNAYLDAAKLTRTKEQFDESLRQLSYVVTSLRYDVGVMLDAGAEKIFVVDEHGVSIDSDRLLTLLTKYMALCHPDMKSVAVPVAASGEIDLVAHEHHVEVVRTPDSHLALMDAASAKIHGFVGGTKGGFIFPQFLFASDAMYSVAKLMECMAIAKKKLGELDGMVPRLTFVKKNLPCPWHAKGRVMRHLMKETEGLPRQLVEGVKVFPPNVGAHTSVLLNPDRARPVFHINAESADLATAQRLSNEFEAKVRAWIDAE